MIFPVGSNGLPTSNAVLHINAPVVSTITLAKGGVTVATLAASKGHTNSDGVTADWYYSVSSGSYGEWTVTATRDTYTATDTVTIDSNRQYDISLKYDLYIIENGVLKTTGKTYHMTVTPDAAEGVTYFQGTNTYPKWWSDQLTSSVLNGGYSKLCADIVRYTGTVDMHFGLSASDSSGTTAELAEWTGKNLSTERHVEVDLANVAITNSYVKVCYAAAIQCVIRNIYLAR